MNQDWDNSMLDPDQYVLPGMGEEFHQESLVQLVRNVCFDRGQHDWTGEEVKLTESASSVTCKDCGKLWLQDWVEEFERNVETNVVRSEVHRLYVSARNAIRKACFKARMRFIGVDLSRGFDSRTVVVTGCGGQVLAVLTERELDNCAHIMELLREKIPADYANQVRSLLKELFNEE